ncbi:multiheme c-type cytochrome [Sphingopyxis sp.]|uniref:multiheme c-type cytochrome n=1 Tax=Sphingopyxis sp. TaxID=1908224 RepID=UPI001D7D8F91|nr:multiheme c-type cytochrome [Sphingopyxis sp.]MBW8296197.1 cytochrome c family protein [Sphingopyxis sp.]
MTTHAGKERGDRPWAAFAALALMLLALALAEFVFAAPARSQGESGARYTGVASCAGSTCHGRMEGDGTVVRQDELMKWQEPSTPGGAHSRAWAVLSNNRSQFIARNLGIGDPATAQMCIGCHATAGAVAAKGAMRGSVPTEDGVGCESCHGPAGGWLASHYAGVGTSANPDAEMRQKHLANLSAGLKKLEDPVVRAGVCVDCHFGSASDGQFVTHRIMAAGHPRIAFELDLFSSLQAHHQEDADYGWRKFGAANARTDHVQMWAVGQATAIERSLALFQSRRGTEGMFPEFYFLDCHSCHRRIFDQAKPVRTGVDNPGRQIPEGMPPYNDENLIMLAAAARLAAPALADQLAARTAAFHKAIATDRPSAVAAAAQLSQTVAALKSAFAARSFTGTDAFAMVDAISAKAIGDRFTDYSGSQQAVMGVDTLLNAMVSSGRVTVGAAAGIRGDIDRAYAAVKDPNAYKPAEFQASLGSAVRAIRALR